MGLDIHIGADNHIELLSGDYYDKKNDYFNKHSLSRTFCYFIARQHIANGEPELDQIGKICGVDITPLQKMGKYWDVESAKYRLSVAKSETEKEEITKKISVDNENLKGNIDLVLQTLNLLIQRLSQIDNLNQILNDSGNDTLGYDFYFTDFNTDKGEGYIGNNFGQDLRNFKRFLEFAIDHGTTTVWFYYG